MNLHAKGKANLERQMPFESQAQRGFMYAKHPEMAKKFEAKTPKGKKLPEHVKGKKPSRKYNAATNSFR